MIKFFTFLLVLQICTMEIDCCKDLNSSFKTTLKRMIKSCSDTAKTDVNEFKKIVDEVIQKTDPGTAIVWICIAKKLGCSKDMTGSEINWPKMQKMLVDYELTPEAVINEASKKCKNKDGPSTQEAAAASFQCFLKEDPDLPCLLRQGF